MANQLASPLLTFVAFIVVVFLSGEGSYAMVGEENCSLLPRELKLPAKLKTRDKSARARWEKVDEVISNLREKMEDTSCSLTLHQLFRPTKKQPIFPLTKNFLQTTPDGSLD